MIIDFRVRAPFEAYKTSPLFANTTNLEQTATRLRLGVPVSESAKVFSMDLLLQEAEVANIEKLVVPVRKACNGNNEDLVTLIKAYPDKIIGLAGIDVVDVQRSIAEIEKYVVHGLCKGIIMEPGQDKTPWLVNSTWVYPIYDYCQRYNVPIAFTYGGIMTKSLRYYNPENIDDVAAAFPKLKIALVHGGWPYTTEVCQIALNRNNVYLVPDIYMVESPGMQDYVMAANVLLTDKIIFASAYPILPLQEAAEYYINSGLQKQVLQKIMYQNAKDFLGIE